MQRVISQFLGEVDGLGGTSDDHVLLLIGATNEPDMIDPAMMRPERLGLRVQVGPPDAAARDGSTPMNEGQNYETNHS
ncbi:MAG: AAA family ATPase [Phycisphaerae bacterium]